MEKLLHAFNTYKENIKSFQQVPLVAYFLTFVTILLLIYCWNNKERRKSKLPPGPWGIPVLGYLPFLGKETFKDFYRLSQIYGNVFGLYLGQTFVVVLGDYEVMKEALSKSCTLNRPERLFDFLPDGEEVDDFIESLLVFGGKPIDAKRQLTASVSNNISSLVFGKRLPLTKENVDFVCTSMDEVFLFFSLTGWKQFFPSIRDALAKFGLLKNGRTKKVFTDFNDYVRKEVELRKKAYTPGSSDNFIDGYLNEMKNYEELNIKSTHNEVNLRGNVQALYLGGSDTTSISITWLLLCMAKYLDIQKKVQQELDAVLGKNGKIQWAERSSVPYTFAVILEGQRWITVAPLNTSRIVYLGQTFVVILGDYEVVKEAFTKSSTLDRPERLFDFLPDGVGFSSVNGKEWVEQRKYSVKAMRDLGLGKSKWEELVQEEVEEFITLISEFGGQPIDANRLLTASVSNNISSLVFGKRLPLTKENVDFVCTSLDEIFLFLSVTGWKHFFPSLSDALGKLGFLKKRKAKKEFIDFNNYVRKEVELRKQVYTPGSSDNFIDGYLTEMKNYEEQHIKSTLNEVNLRGNVQALYLGGSDTTRTSITWLLLCMVKYPDIQKKVHQELDAVLGKDGKIQWAERSSVPFTYAVIMEGQRWRTIAPLNTPRIAMEDIKIGGYDIPKGTTIIANNWGLHNDTNYWKDPEIFLPERFLIENGKQVNYKPESYVPFSYGKRSCPGETVAMIEILCYFAAIMNNFEILPVENEEPIMEGIQGLTYQPIPQKLRFIPRK